MCYTEGVTLSYSVVKIRLIWWFPTILCSLFRSCVPFRSIPVCWFVSSFIGLVHIVSLVVYFRSPRNIMGAWFSCPVFRSVPFLCVPVFRSVPFLCVGLYLHSLGFFISYRRLSISGLLGKSWGLQIFLGTSNTGILPDTVVIYHDTP